jgi:hypothetical protein
METLKSRSPGLQTLGERTPEPGKCDMIPSGTSAVHGQSEELLNPSEGCRNCPPVPVDKVRCPKTLSASFYCCTLS